MTTRTELDRHVIYLALCGADRRRLQQIADEQQMSMSGLLRMAMNDYLESIEEPVLKNMNRRSRRSWPNAYRQLKSESPS